MTAKLEWSNARGSMSIEPRGPSALLVTVQGYCDSEMGLGLAQAFDDGLRSQRLRYVFIDADELESYHSHVRTEPTSVCMGHIGRIAIHVLARSKLVRMGLAVASIALPGTVHVYGERGAFLRAMNAALAER